MEGRRVGALSLAVVTSAALAVTGAGATQAVPTIDGVPRLAHVVIWVLENENATATWSPSSPAKYLNSLVPQGAFVPQYYATGHASLDNYVAMTSGVAGPLVINTYPDCAGLSLWTCTQEVSLAAHTGNIADQVEKAGMGWTQYSDGTSAPCVHAPYAPTAGPDSFQGDSATPESSTAGPNYADRHVPFLYYADIIGNTARCTAHLRPFSDLSADLAAGHLPAYSFITPDTCDDGHDSPCADGRPGGLITADAFLQANLPPLLTYLQANNGLLIITTDEASTNDLSGCCTGGPLGLRGFGGRVGLLALGTGVAAGTSSTKQYDHASLLRTVEDALGIHVHLNNAATAHAMQDIWAK